MRLPQLSHLSDGPKTLEQIKDHFQSYLRYIGLFLMLGHLEQREARIRQRLQAKLATLLSLGWITYNDALYELTPLGMDASERLLRDMRRTREVFRKLAQPDRVGAISMGAHLLLAALKLPAGLLSGSIGLVNDATDTLIDGLASLLVYAGIHFDKERTVNVILVLLMLVTGLWTFVQAGLRFFKPYEPQIDGFTFAAVLISALICAVLGIYQRWIGLRSATMALITQSVDSRNHVIIAASVISGLIAARLDFPLLDTLVGLGVALLMLKSAVELAIETIRSFDELEPDLSRYRDGISNRYDQFRTTQLRDWMLYRISRQDIRTCDDLLNVTTQSLRYQNNPVLEKLGIAQNMNDDGYITKAFADFTSQGWITDETPLALSKKGHRRLHLLMRTPRWIKRHATSRG